MCWPRWPAGEVTRQGKDYVSVRLDGEQKPVRLKGAIYGQDWTAAEAIREAESPDAGRSRGGTGIDYEAATKEHASALREARAAALSTTQDVTARHLHQIEKMQRQHLQQLRRSLWVLWLVPLVILMLCGVTLAATWKAVEWKTETERISRANQIRLLDQQYCAQRPGNCQPQKQTQPPPSQNRK